MRNMIKILLVLAKNGYHPLEYGVTRDILEDSGFKVEIASNAKGSAHVFKGHDSPVHPEYSKVKVDKVVKDINPNDYNGIFLIGGPGALKNLDNLDTYNLFNRFAKLNRPFGAICISPVILAKAGLLTDKKATSWSSNIKSKEIFDEYGVMNLNKDVVVDGNIVTANGPLAAENFAKEIINLYK